MNDLWGCGNVGAPGTCEGLDRDAENVCAALPESWQYDQLGGEYEALAVVQHSAEHGGVLCCTDLR